MIARGQCRGVTLVELLVAMLVGGIVLVAVTRVTLWAAGANDRTRERIRQQVLLRDAAGILQRELAGLDPATDLAAAARESITVRSVRGSGRTCGRDAGAVVIAMSTYRAWRLPDPARDSLLVRLDGGAGAWGSTPIIGPTTRSSCRDGSPGLRLPVDDSVAGMADTAALAVRVIEWTRIRLYQSGGAWWLGSRSLRPGDVIQPLAGPFPARGIELAYQDASGSSVAPGPSARRVALLIRGGTRATVASRRDVAPDSLTAWAMLGSDAP